MITRTELLKQFEIFKEARGKIVIIHISLKAVGEIEGGGETLLDALIEYFTADGGLLCVPTHTWGCGNYDRRKAETCLGVLPSLAAAHPNGQRTLNPTHSMVVFGDREKAKAFAEFDDNIESPTDPTGCYAKLNDLDGYVLLIGVGQDKSTYIHAVEEMLKVPGRMTEEKVDKLIIHPDGTEEKKPIYWYKEIEGVLDYSWNFTKFEEPFRYFGCITDGTVGNAPVQLCSARKIKEVIELIYTNNHFGELLADDLPVDEKLYKRG